ncbi:MAG: DDE-type integrase/transposase/recombinase, partial [Conexivisphaera sp.]
SGLSFRRTSRALGAAMRRSHTSIWKWVHRYSPVLGSFDVDRGSVRSIFIDETMVNLGGTPAWIWVAFEPSLRAVLDFRVSWRGNSIDAYLFVRRLVRRYGRVTIYTDGAGWYVDACRWAGVPHVVYDHPLKNLMERINQYLKDRTESFDDLYPMRRPGHPFERVLSWLSGFKFLRNHCSRTRGWGGRRWSGTRRRGWRDPSSAGSWAG